jgi:hypothetical protein
MMGNRKFLSLVLSLVVCSFFGSARSVLADSLLVAPNGNTSANGTAPYDYLFQPLNNFQWGFATSQLTAMVGDSITGLGFRLAPNLSSIPGPITIGTFDLQLSSSLNPIGGLSTNYANNIASNVTTVYSGGLTLGSLTGGAGPNPFFMINFANPFTYTRGDLLMTLNMADISTPVLIDANFAGGNLGETVWCTGGSCVAGYFDVPITEFQYAPSAVPEPGTLVLLSSGLFAIGTLRRKRFFR